MRKLIGTHDTRNGLPGKPIRIIDDREHGDFIHIAGRKHILLTPQAAYDMADFLVDLAEAIERNEA